MGIKRDPRLIRQGDDAVGGFGSQYYQADRWARRGLTCSRRFLLCTQIFGASVRWVEQRVVRCLGPTLLPLELPVFRRASAFIPVRRRFRSSDSVAVPYGSFPVQFRPTLSRKVSCSAAAEWYLSHFGRLSYPFLAKNGPSLEFSSPESAPPTSAGCHGDHVSSGSHLHL